MIRSSLRLVEEALAQNGAQASRRRPCGATASRGNRIVTDTTLPGAAMSDPDLHRMLQLCQEALARPASERAAYLDESCAAELYVRPYPSGADQTSVSVGSGGLQPVWSRDGSELFYVRGRTPDELALVVHRVASDGTIDLNGQALFKLAPLRLKRPAPLPGYDVTRDGQHFLFVQMLDTSPPPPPSQIHIVQNWFEELKAKAPRK